MNIWFPVIDGHPTTLYSREIRLKMLAMLAVSRPSRGKAMDCWTDIPLWRLCPVIVLVEGLIVMPSNAIDIVIPSDISVSSLFILSSYLRFWHFWSGTRWPTHRFSWNATPVSQPKHLWWDPCWAWQVASSWWTGTKSRMYILLLAPWFFKCFFGVWIDFYVSFWQEP